MRNDGLKTFTVRIFIQGEDIVYSELSARDAYDALEQAATKALAKDLSYIQGGQQWVLNKRGF